MEYKHSVSLDIDRCKGCTNCLKRCPTQAIRIRDGHAVINSRLCIDCGACIRICPHKAKKANFDRMEDIPEKKKWRIALPAPSLYGQFDHLDDVDYVLQGLLDIGFDQVFEVAQAAELVSEYTRNYMRRMDIPRPVINSACPTIVRLISLRFPYLCDHIMPILPPIEIASRLAKAEALRKHPELREDEICTVFISPCPAKASFVKNWSTPSDSVDYVVSMSDIYFRLLPVMRRGVAPEATSRTGRTGISWASTGGEGGALYSDRYLAADGIENVIRVLDQIETGSFPMLDFIELNACDGGCVGGVATVENPYIARVRLQSIRRYLPVSENRIPPYGDASFVPNGFMYDSMIQYRPAARLDEDMERALEKMSHIEEIYATLPELDCGFCGAPTCRAFAEDVVRGECRPEECIVRMRERVQQLHQEEREQP